MQDILGRKSREYQLIETSGLGKFSSPRIVQDQKFQRQVAEELHVFTTFD